MPQYPWVFLNDEPFTEDFKAAVMSMTRSKVYFGQIPREHWSYPSWVDLKKAAAERKKMEDENVIYGGSESYRMMCRFNSGFFYRHPLMMQFNYYWRVEPGVEYYCDVDRDLYVRSSSLTCAVADHVSAQVSLRSSSAR